MSSEPDPGEETRELLAFEEAFAREDGIEGHRPVALAEQKAVAVLPGRVRRVDPEDALVEDVKDVERRGGARGVLLVAGLQRDQIAEFLAFRSASPP